MFGISMNTTKTSQRIINATNDKNIVQEPLFVKKGNRTPLNIMLVENDYQKNSLKITDIKDANLICQQKSTKIMPNEKYNNSLQLDQIILREDTVEILNRMSVSDIVAKIINVGSNNAAKLMCNLYDSEKGKAIYSQLIQMGLINKAVEISVVSLHINSAITAYQIEKLSTLQIVELITNMENEDAAKILSNLHNTDIAAKVYHQLLKKIDLKKVAEIVTIALHIAPGIVGYQISKLETKTIASIIKNMENNDAVNLISNIYDNEKIASIYKKLLHECEIDKVANLMLASIKKSPLITGYQIDEMHPNNITMLIISISSVDAAKILCSMYDNDKGGAVYEQLIKLGETKKAINIYKEAQKFSLSKTQSQIDSITSINKSLFTLPLTETTN